MNYTIKKWMNIQSFPGLTQDATQAAKANVAAAAAWLAAQGSQVLVRQARNCQADVCGVVGGFLKGNPYSNMMVYDMNSGNSVVLRCHLDAFLAAQKNMGVILHLHPSWPEGALRLAS